jgi:hypothetical protein
MPARPGDHARAKTLLSIWKLCSGLPANCLAAYSPVAERHSVGSRHSRRAGGVVAHSDRRNRHARQNSPVTRFAA